MGNHADRPLRTSVLMGNDAVPGGTIRFTNDPADLDPAAVSVILDTTWTAPIAPSAPGSATAAASGGPGRVVGLRDVAERVLSTLDLIDETSARLDRWAADSGVVERLMI